MAGRKRSRSRRAAGPVARMRGWCGRRLVAMRRASASWRRPWRPTVKADVDGRRGRRLRRAITRVARDHVRGLCVTPPGHLLVVVQRTVELEGRPLGSLLQVFEEAGGRRRNVLFLALAAGGREVDDGELLATLRQQLQRVVSGELGTPVSLSGAPAEAGPGETAAGPERGEWVGPFERERSPLEAFGGPGGAFAAAAEGSNGR
ncbi:MAG: hypothetical protein OXC94_11915 [Chloroflexi bacterium]|nr:hypothetical protein [Chloroflexota bacterium]